MKRDRFIMFLAALIPGVGYMYLGLLKKGIEALVAFLLIKPLLTIIGIGWMAPVIMIPFMLYTFFDTYNVSAKIDSGMVVQDEDIFNIEKYNKVDSHKILNIFAYILIAIGVLAIINLACAKLEVYALIKNYVMIYFVPVVMIFVGIYILFKKR